MEFCWTETQWGDLDEFGEIKFTKHTGQQKKLKGWFGTSKKQRLTFELDFMCFCWNQTAVDLILCLLGRLRVIKKRSFTSHRQMARYHLSNRLSMSRDHNLGFFWLLHFLLFLPNKSPHENLNTRPVDVVARTAPRNQLDKVNDRLDHGPRWLCREPDVNVAWPKTFNQID